MTVYHPTKNVELVKPLKWLLGRWNAVKAVVSYPTMCPMHYGEILCFTFLGQPLVNYTSRTFNLKTKQPIHLESGFLRIDANRNVSLLTAMNFGFTAIEEGRAGEEFLLVKSRLIGTTKFARAEVCALQRCYKINDKGQLVFNLKMQTKDVVLTDHLYAVYEKDKTFPSELD